MFRLERECLFSQFQRGLRITLCQLLFHDAAHTDKTGGFVSDQLAIGLFCLATVACQFSGLGGQQIGQGRFVQVFVRLLRLGEGDLAFSAGQGHQPFGQGVKTFALAVAVKIARQCGFIPVEEFQRRHQKRKYLEQQPDRDHQNDHGDHRLKRPKAVFGAHHGHLNAPLAFQQISRTPSHRCNRGDKGNNLDQ